MGLQLVKEVASVGTSVWQTVYETAQGGFTLDITGLTVGNTIKAGIPFTFDEETRKAKPATITNTVSNAKGVLYKDVVIAAGASVDVVLIGTIYERRINDDKSAIAAEHKDALKGSIIFSQSR